jgi:hypothetical protein
MKEAKGHNAHFIILFFKYDFNGLKFNIGHQGNINLKKKNPQKLDLIENKLCIN